MLNYLFGTSVKQGELTSEISGLNFRSFDDDIKTQFGTSTPGRYMFRRVNSTRFVTDNFFLLELEFLIQQLLQSKNIWSKRRDVYDLQTKLRSETWIKNTINPTFPEPDWALLKRTFTLEPYATQRDFLGMYQGIKSAYNLKGLLLDALPGSGKTLVSLMWGVLNKNKKHIILSPNMAFENAWMKHIQEKAFKTPPKLWSTRSKGPFDPSADYFLFHHEYVRNPEFFNLVKKIFQSANGGGVDLVIDECHNFNELTSKQTQNLIAVCDHFPFNDCLPMSGTPLKNMGREAYTAFVCIDNYFVGSARERFSKSYGLSRDKLNTLLARRIGRMKFTIESLVGMQHKEPDVEVKKVSFDGAKEYTLRNISLRMAEFITERIKFYEDEMPRMVEFYEGIVRNYEQSIATDNYALADLVRYKQIVKKFRTYGYSSFTDIEDSKFAKQVELKIEAGLKGQTLKEFRNVKSAVKYVGLKIRGEALGLVLGRSRMNAIRDTIANAGLKALIDDSSKKTLIFTSYVDALEECERHLKEVGFTPITIYGENNHLRDQSIDLFNKNPSINPAVTTFDSLKEGVDMTVASLEIFLNSPWRDYEMKQAKARIYRQGQDTEVRFVLLDLDTGTEPNITTRSIDIMEWSKEQTEILLGRNSVNNSAMRTIMGTEDYAIIDEPVTSKMVRSQNSVLSLF